MICMNNRIGKLVGLGVSCWVLVACEANFESPVEDKTYSKGNADFSQFVTIGDSLTAGYADGALYKSGQENSYPAILAQQFDLVDGGSFIQPLMNDDLGGLLFAGVENPSFPKRLVLDATTESPELIAGTPSTEATLALTGGPFNNMGVPGAKSFHLVADGYGNPAGLLTDPIAANPYFVRFAATSDTSVVTDAVAQQPTFFTLWIGNNDLLLYATEGGVGVDRTGNLDATTYSQNVNDITDPDLFSIVYSQLIAKLTAANAKGVLINIPDVSAIPYFTTVPYNAVPLDQATADALNANPKYVAYNAGVKTALGDDSDEAAQRQIKFTVGQNAVVISDEDLTDLTGAGLPSMRQATASDLLVLKTSSIIGTAFENDETAVWGISKPLEDKDVLIPSEITAIETARQAFNVKIKAEADANDNLILVDMATILSELSTTGVDYGTGSIDATYATGGGFSLDGVHPTARGYAVIANEIIKAINAGFEATIPTVDPGAYSTIFVK